MPGGDILGVDFFPDCDFDQAGRRAIAETVYLSAPLPYQGFEHVFNREIRMVFHAPGEQGRKGSSSASSTPARSDVTNTARQEDYKRRCSFQLWWDAPAVELKRVQTVLATVDRSGTVVGLEEMWGQPIEEELAGALRATPCEAVPDDLFTGADTVEIGPILVRRRSE